MSNNQKRLTRDSIPSIEEGDRIVIKTINDKYSGTIQNISENRDSTTIKLNLDDIKGIQNMYADVRCVEAIIKNNSKFVKDISIIN